MGRLCGNRISQFHTNTRTKNKRLLRQKYLENEAVLRDLQGLPKTLTTGEGFLFFGEMNAISALPGNIRNSSTIMRPFRAWLKAYSLQPNAYCQKLTANSQYLHKTPPTKRVFSAPLRVFSFDLLNHSIYSQKDN